MAIAPHSPTPKLSSMKVDSENTRPRRHSRLEHVDITTAEGGPLLHATGRNRPANIEGANTDLDWWRTPNIPKSFLEKVVAAIWRK